MIGRLAVGLVAAGALLAAPGCRASLRPERVPGLAGTSWRLVRFEGGDGGVLTPPAGADYTVAFGTDGRVAVRLGCNRGTATWTAEGPALALGPLALTRALCPDPTLHDQVVRQWPYIRSYVIENGRLFLALQADGGIYELEPLTGAPASPASSSGASRPPGGGTPPAGP